MSSDYENSNMPEIDDTPSIRVQVAEFVFIANARVLPARRVPLTAALMVADRVLSRSSYTDLTARAFAVERAVDRFLSLATIGPRTGETVEYLDLLPVSHPLSTALSPLTASAIAEARAEWLAADPRITDELRPLVASAYTMEFGSIERTHALARLEAAGNELPLDLLALVAVGGNSSAARSARARRQLRDRLKRFAYEGGMGGFLVRFGSMVKSQVGSLVGGSSNTNTGEVYITEDDEALGLKKGDIVTVSLDNYEGMDVVLTKAELDKAGVDVSDGKASSSKRAQDIADLLASKREAPSDWTKLPNGDFVTEDGFTATPKGDLKYELKDENGNIVEGLEAAGWPDIQKAIKKVAEDEFGTGIEEDTATYLKKDLKVDQLAVGDQLPQYYPIKGAEANLLKKREEDPNYELPPTDEIIGTYKASDPKKRGIKVRDLATGKERYFEVNKTARIYDVRQKQLTPVQPEPQKSEPEAIATLPEEPRLPFTKENLKKHIDGVKWKETTKEDGLEDGERRWELKEKGNLVGVVYMDADGNFSREFWGDSYDNENNRTDMFYGQDDHKSDWQGAFDGTDIAPTPLPKTPYVPVDAEDEHPGPGPDNSSIDKLLDGTDWKETTDPDSLFPGEREFELLDEDGDVTSVVIARNDGTFTRYDFYASYNNENEKSMKEDGESSTGDIEEAFGVVSTAPAEPAASPSAFRWPTQKNQEKRTFWNPKEQKFVNSKEETGKSSATYTHPLSQLSGKAATRVREALQQKITKLKGMDQNDPNVQSELARASKALPFWREQELRSLNGILSEITMGDIDAGIEALNDYVKPGEDSELNAEKNASALAKVQQQVGKEVTGKTYTDSSEDPLKYPGWKGMNAEQVTGPQLATIRDLVDKKDLSPEEREEILRKANNTLQIGDASSLINKLMKAPFRKGGQITPGTDPLNKHSDPFLERVKILVAPYDQDFKLRDAIDFGGASKQDVLDLFNSEDALTGDLGAMLRFMSIDKFNEAKKEILGASEKLDSGKATPAVKTAPKNPPSKKQKEMIRSMLLERVMTSEQRQEYMDKLAAVDKFEVNGLFNELKALPKAKVPLTDGTDPLNQHENPELAKIKQKLAPFDLNGSIRRYIDEKTANGEEVSSQEIRELLKGNKDWDASATSYADYKQEADSLRSALFNYKTESEKQAANEANANYEAAQEALKAKLDALKKNQAESTSQSKEEHQAKLNELAGLISDENDPDRLVRDGILDGTLRTGDDIVAALRKQEIKNEYKTMSRTKFASGYEYLTADESENPESWAIINAAYGLSPAPEGFEPQFVANSLRDYDNETGDLSKLINSGASANEILDWLNTNSPAWKNRQNDYDTRMYVDMPWPFQKASWKKFGELRDTIFALDKDKPAADDQPNVEFVSALSEKLPEDTIASLDSKLGTAFNDGDTLSELLAKVDTEEDLQRVVDEITATRATNKDVTPQLDGQLKQVQDAAIQKFYEDNPDLENTMAEPANIVVPDTQPEPVAEPEAESEPSPLTVSELNSSLEDLSDLEGGWPQSLYEQVDEIQEGADDIEVLKEEVADLLGEGDKEAAVKKLNELADAYEYFANQVELARELGADAFDDPDWKKKDQDDVIADYKKAAAFARDLATAAKVDTESEPGTPDKNYAAVITDGADIKSGELVHFTTPENAKAILEDGFNPEGKDTLGGSQWGIPGAMFAAEYGYDMSEYMASEYWAQNPDQQGIGKLKVELPADTRVLKATWTNNKKELETQAGLDKIGAGGAFDFIQNKREEEKASGKGLTEPVEHLIAQWASQSGEFDAVDFGGEVIIFNKNQQDVAPKDLFEVFDENKPEQPQAQSINDVEFGSTQTYEIGDTVYADYDPKDTGIGFIRTGKVIDRNLATGDYLVQVDDTNANGNSAGKKIAFNKKDMAPLAAKPEPTPEEPTPAEETVDVVENPFSTDNSDKALTESSVDREAVDDFDAKIAVILDKEDTGYEPMLKGITGNENIVKNILDDLDASDGANSIALSSSLYELKEALATQGASPEITEYIQKLADTLDDFTPADTGSKNNLVTVDTIKEEQDGILDLSGWKKVGGQKGSNPGGTYEDPETGEQVYVKTPKSQLHGENERLASALYDAAGISSAKVLKGKLADGTEVTYSPIIEGSTPDLKKKLKDKAYMARLQQGFAIDALLANWDVIGLDYDNVVTDKNGEPVRVDPGGALLFRAQGSPKGGAFGEDVPELDAFTDKTSSRPSAKVFSQMTDEQKLESAKVLQNLSPSQIEELVNSIITDPEKREELKTKLKARREAILGKFELSTKPAKKKNPEAGSSGKTVTLDVTGDNDSLKAQLEEAAKNGDLVSFKYNDKERIVAPTYVWTNPKNGNINLTGDEDGVSKNYTLQNFKQSSATPSEESTPVESTPAETTALSLGDESIRTEAAKSVQSQLPDGYTATPEKGVGNAGFVMVKNAQGETVAMMTNDPNDPNKIAVQNFKAGWEIETVSSVSEGMNKLVDAVKVVEEPGQVVQLSDGSTGKLGTKVVHNKNGITGTIVGFQKDPNYVKVKPDNGDPIKIMSIKQIKSNGSGGEGATPPTTPNAPEAPVTFVPQVSESMTLFSGSDGQMAKVIVIKGTDGEWDVVYDFNGPDFKPLHVGLASREEAEAKALTALGTNNFESDVPEADEEPAEPTGPKKFTFDFMGLKDVEDAPEVKDSGDPLDGENEKIKADSAGTLIKPGAIVKDENGRVGVYRTPGYGDPTKIRMIWEDGTQDSVMPDTVTATGKYLSPGIAGVYAGLADLDFDKNAVPMPDNYTGGMKDKNGKDIGFKQLVIDKNGDMGVVVDQYGADGYIKVAYPDGTKKRKADTVTALDLQYKKNDYNIKIAQKHYKSLAANDAARYNLPSFGVAITKANVEPGKIPVPKNAFGAKAKEVKTLGWNESDFEDAPSLEALLAMVSDTNKPGAGLRGGSIALDADSVEDLDLRILDAIGTDGNDAYLLKYKLTNWAGDALANQLVEMVKNGDPRVTVSTGLSVPENSVQGGKISFNPSLGAPSDKIAYKSGYGQTFIITLDDGTKIHFLRADIPTNHKTGAVKISEYAPKAFHNKVMIIAPKDKSTPESLALALQTAGVQDVRPSTKQDSAILIENRLMSIFDEKVDPRTNPSGAERAASLQRIKDKWGIGPENVTIKTGAGGRIEMRLDEESAKMIVQKTGVKVLRHNLTGNGANKNASSNETPEQRRERIAEYFANRVATPQGGLLSTTTRWSEGVGGGGMSSQADVNTGGADYVFTTPASKPNSGNDYDVPLIYFSGERAFQRLDFWANQSDKFGKRIGKSPIDQAVPGGYEVMFKGRLSFDDAEVLMVKDQTMRTLIITKLRQKGITEIGGRPLEAVIMTGDDYSAAQLAKLAQSTNITT